MVLFKQNAKKVTEMVQILPWNTQKRSSNSTVVELFIFFHVIIINVSESPAGLMDIERMFLSFKQINSVCWDVQLTVWL